MTRPAHMATGDRHRPGGPAGALGLVAVAAAMAVTSCGVPTDEQPRAIASTTVAPASTPTTIAPAEGFSVSVYFLREDRLEARQYTVQGRPGPASLLSQAIGFALQNPAEGSPASLRTAAPPDTSLRSASIDDGTARIDLTGEINSVGGPSQKQAFAQLVFTALGVPGVRQVRFQIDGMDVDVTTDNGSRTVVTANDYKAPLNPR